MLRVENVFYSFGSKRVLDGVSFELPPATIAGLIGPSGSGKSLLMKLMGGVRAPQSGSLRFAGRITRSGKGASIGLMFQEGALFDSLSVFDNVAFPLVGGKVPASLLHGAERDQVEQKVPEILQRVGLLEARNKMPGQLSGGMRRRASLARALVGRPALVLLDDPTAGLDPVASSVIMNLIVELHREYRPTLLMVSQDLRRLLPVVDTILALYNGKIRFSGTLQQLKDYESPFLHSFVSCRYDLAA